MEVIAPFSRWENPERYSVTYPKPYSFAVTEVTFEYAVSFILSHPNKLTVSLTSLDHVCHLAYSKISAFLPRKGQAGYREE